MRVHGKFKLTTQLLLLTLGEGTGEVWVNMRHNVYTALVVARGFSAVARTDPLPLHPYNRLVNLAESTLDIEIELDFFWQSLPLVTLGFRPILTARVLKSKPNNLLTSVFFLKKKGKNG